MTQDAFTNYESLWRYILQDGYKLKNGTRARFGNTFTVERCAFLSDDESLDYIVMPAWRNANNISANYAIAESFWYAMATRSPEAIIPHGKIWQSMTNDEGLINSNYGYQLMTNNDLGKAVDDAASLMGSAIARSTDSEKLQIDLFIATPQNCSEAYDTVCNNVLSIVIETDTAAESPTVRVQSTMLARSIDLMFGLPYDIAAIQGFTINLLKNAYAKLDDPTLKVIYETATLQMVNAHVYERDIPRFELDRYEGTAPWNLPASMMAVKIAGTGFEWTPELQDNYGIEPFQFTASERMRLPENVTLKQLVNLLLLDPTTVTVRQAVNKPDTTAVSAANRAFASKFKTPMINSKTYDNGLTADAKTAMIDDVCEHHSRKAMQVRTLADEHVVEFSYMLPFDDNNHPGPCSFVTSFSNRYARF